jgi:hypothetical protein
LPGLARAAAGSPADWLVASGDQAAFGSGFETVHEWTGEDGRALMGCARSAGRYCLSFYGLARFLIDFDRRRIETLPEHSCPDDTLAHLLLDQVFPRVLCHQGRVVLHASAVRLPGGEAIAFSGPSGAGKSTLALALHRAGCPLLADDCLLVEIKDGVASAVPAYASVRLWPDSYEAMRESTETEPDAVAVAHYTSKRQVYLQAGDDGTAPGRYPLSKIYLLGAGSAASEKEIRSENASGTRAIMALVEAMFTLDVTDSDSVRRGFNGAGEIARHVDVRLLSYPRRYPELEGLAARLKAPAG